MKEFFKGWRRKVGVMTLALACVAMTGWVRNYFLQDSLNIPTGNSSSLQFISGDQCLNLFAMWSTIPDKEMATFRYCCHYANEGIGIHAGETLEYEESSPFRPRWFKFDIWGKEFSSMTFSVPYWSITIPLTLFSALLLLTKPRRSTPKNSAERTANEELTL